MAIAIDPSVFVLSAGVNNRRRRVFSFLYSIVFTNVSDPVGSGFISSLARPNITGVLLYEDGVVSKWLAMLKEISPRLGSVALLGNPKATPFDYFRRSAEAAIPRRERPSRALSRSRAKSSCE
jgi:hypothetical protein